MRRTAAFTILATAAAATAKFEDKWEKFCGVPDCYTELGLFPNATKAQIRRAYRSLSLEFHPDKNPGDSRALRKFNRVARANEVLTDDEQRKKLDYYTVRSRRFEVLRRLHFLGWTRGHLTMPGVVSFSSLRPFGPNRDAPRRFARKLRQSIEERQEERDATERARILEKGALQKDYERRSKEIRKEARREMARGLDADTLKVVAQNKSLSEELHFQREMSEDLKHKESKWKALATEARRDVELLRESEKERAAIAVRKSKEAKAREERITALESQLKELRKSTQAETSKLRRNLENALEEQTLDAAGLRQMVRIKQKELSKLRKAAETVLEQRTEVEQFFLDALERVKSEVTAKREAAYAKDVQAYRTSMRTASNDPSGTATFPKIRALQAGKDVSRFGMVETEPPKRYEGRVQLSDLTAEDREHVLRLLFAKINAVHGSVQPRPEHTMAADGTFLTTPMVALPSAPPPPT